MGWWWNRKVHMPQSIGFLYLTASKILPWDSDIDVQLTYDTLSFLFNYYQLYVFHYKLPDIPEGRDYMLEINPGYAHDDPKSDHLNAIDARWIDMTTGLFIDMTAVRPNETARAMGQEGALRCKDKHSYNVRQARQRAKYQYCVAYLTGS